MFFSSKNHKCIYFRLHSKIIKRTYLFLIKSIDIKYLMVDLVLYITHIYFGVHKSKRLEIRILGHTKEHNPQALGVSIHERIENKLAIGIGGSNVQWGTKK